MNKTFYEIYYDGLGPLIPEVEKIALNSNGDLLDINGFYNIFKTNKEIFDLAEKVSSMSGTDPYILLQMMYQFYHFIIYGKKVFKITDNLTESLIATDLKRVPAELVKLPFPTVCFSFNKSYIRMHFDQVSKPVNMNEMYITQIDHDDKYHIRLMFLGKTDEGHDLFRTHQVYLIKNKPIEDAIEMAGSLDIPERELQLAYQKSVQAAIQFAFNIVLYISSKDIRNEVSLVKHPVPELKSINPKKVRKYNKKYKDSSRLSYYNLGTDITISPYKNEAPQGDDFTQKFHYTYRFTVRGHWRHYIVNNQGKPKWIAPYYKGPTTADLVDKSYKVK